MLIGFEIYVGFLNSQLKVFVWFFFDVLKFAILRFYLDYYGLICVFLIV